MAAPSEEKLIHDIFNLEALTVNQVKSFKALADDSRSAKGGEKGDPNRNPWLAKMGLYMCPDLGIRNYTDINIKMGKN
jgi:hypothetical protein